jgi:hypothetical protein
MKQKILNQANNLKDWANCVKKEQYDKKYNNVK